MKIEIKITKSNHPYGGSHSFCGQIYINGDWFKEVIPESEDFNDLLPCIVHSLKRDEDFKFIEKNELDQKSYSFNELVEYMTAFTIGGAYSVEDAKTNTPNLFGEQKEKVLNWFRDQNANIS